MRSLPDSLDHSCGVFVESAPFRSATSDVKAKASASLHGEVTKQTTWLRMKMNDQLRAAVIRLGPRVTVGLPFSEAIPATGAASSTPSTPPASRSSRTVLFPSAARHPRRQDDRSGIPPACAASVSSWHRAGISVRRRSASRQRRSFRPSARRRRCRGSPVFVGQQFDRLLVTSA